MCLDEPVKTLNGLETLTDKLWLVLNCAYTSAKESYPKSSPLPRCTSGLEGEVSLMEKQYDECCELKIRADTHGMDESSLVLTISTKNSSRVH